MIPVLVLQDNPVLNDRRVWREVNTISTIAPVMVWEPEGNPSEERIGNITIRRVIPNSVFTLRKFQTRKQLADSVAAIHPKILHCHDQHMFNLGCLAKKRLPSLKLIYDSHELFGSYPLLIASGAGRWLKFKSLLVRWYEINREAANSRWIDYLITVNESISHQLASRLQLKKRPVILRNCCEAEVKEEAFSIRQKLSISNKVKIIVFFGRWMHRHSLNLETVIGELANKPGLALVFITGFNSDKQWFQNHVKEQRIDNVFFHDFIPYNQTRNALRECDIGLVPTWNRKQKSYWLALDNKIFEYMHAGLPILATAQPEYKKIIDATGAGICVNGDEKQSFYNGVNQLLSDAETYSRKSRQAAAYHCWEWEEKKLLELYEQLLSNSAW